MGKNLILISCSDHKMGNGGNEYSYSDSIRFMLNKETQKDVLTKRKELFDLIKNGRIKDLLRAGGNRKDSPYNLNLQEEPDIKPGYPLGQNVNIRYLPAYKRYEGRFYTSAGIDVFEGAISKGCHTLIVSGLYGLITLTEPIQRYSCHLDDVIEPIIQTSFNLDIPSNQVKVRVSDLWGDIFYRSLKEYIEYHSQHEGHRIEKIVDLLSEYSYQRIFQWEDLISWFRNNGIKIYHRVVPKKREPEFLPDLGQYYAEIIRTWETFEPPSQEKGSLIYFTEELQPDPYIQERLKWIMTEKVWNRLNKRTRNELIQGERFYDLATARSEDLQEKSGRNMLYFNALENELRCIFGNVKDENERDVQGTIGQYRYHLRQGMLKDRLISQKEDLLKDLYYIIDMRNEVAHGPDITIQQLMDTRRLIIEPNGVLDRLISIKLTDRESI